MKHSTQLGKRFIKALGLLVIQAVVVASANSTDLGPSSAGSPTRDQGGRASGETMPATACGDFDACMTLGKQQLKEQPKQALAAFASARDFAKGEPVRLAEAYANMGLAHAAMGDRGAALEDLKQAGKIAPGKLAWAEKEYQRLLGSETIVPADEIKHRLDLAQPAAGTAEEPLQTASGETPAEPASAAEGGEFTANMGRTRSLEIAMAEDEPRRPAPKSFTKPKPKPRPAARPRVGHSLADQPSLDLRINFEFNSADLTTDGQKQAQELGKALEKIRDEDQSARFMLLGHTDSIGSEQYNLQLSRERAEAVKGYLIANFPALGDSLRAEGMGKRYPLFTTLDEESHQLNRRVEVKRLQ